MESKKSKETKNSKDKEKTEENQSKNEFSQEKFEEENIFLELLKNSLLKEEQNKNDKSKKDKEILSKSNNSESSFISASIEKLKNGDDMDIMSELIALCEKLSLASDQIGDNINMPRLLEEICKNLEKLYLPEIIIYSLQCINYILDINPGLASVLKRVSAIPKIIGLITAMEDSFCLEYIISIFEKISFENSYLLFENNVFLSLINVIDFLGLPQRKSVMKICQNISVNVITNKEFEQYIKPALETLCNLTIFNEENYYINEKAILIYYNIIILLNQGFYFNNNPDLENTLTKYSFMNNFCEILKKFFLENNKKISAEIVKRILKVINIIFKVSKKETDKLLSLDFLGIVSEIIHNEFNDIIKSENNQIKISNTNNNNSNDGNNLNTVKSNSSFLTEIFLLLISLFPENKDSKDKKKIKDEKILSKENIKYYNYLCKNIIKPLVDNIMAKSACSTLSNLIKFILVFSKASNKENIQNYINSKQMAQIISKLLDTKYELYIYDLISLLEIFMSKTPEHFIKNLIREGIIENIKNYDFSPKKSKKKKKKEKKEKNKDKEKEKDKDNDSFSDILDEENEENNENSDGYIDMEIENENEEKNDLGKDDDSIPMDIENNDDKKDKNKNKEKIKKDKEKINNKKDKDNDDKDKYDKDKDIFEFKYKKEFKFNLDNFSSKSFEEKEKMLKKFLESTRKEKKKEAELKIKNERILLEGKIKDFKEKYISDEKMKFYLGKIKNIELINLKDTLTNLEKELKEACDKKDDNQIKIVIQKILKILSEPKNEITFFELENSKILIGLCNYFEPIFITQYDKLDIENDNELQKNININDLVPSPLTLNTEIFDKIKLFLGCLTENKNKLVNYIKLLEYSITSMNCFSMIINDTQNNYNLNLYYNQSL